MGYVSERSDLYLAARVFAGALRVNCDRGLNLSLSGNSLPQQILITQETREVTHGLLKAGN